MFRDLELTRARLSEIISQRRRSQEHECDVQAFREKKTGSHFGYLEEVRGKNNFLGSAVATVECGWLARSGRIGTRQGLTT